MAKGIWEVLGLETVPSLAVGGTKGGDRLPVRLRKETAGMTLPSSLSKLVQSEPFPDPNYATCIYDGSCLSAAGKRACVEILAQPYVFYDALPGDKKNTSVELAVFLTDGEFAYFTVTSAGASINPSSLANQWATSEIYYENGEARLVSDKSSVTIVSSLPAVAFYSVCRVHHENRPVRTAVTFHIILGQPLPLSRYLQAWALEGSLAGSAGLFGYLFQQIELANPRTAITDIIPAWMHSDPSSESELYVHFLERVIWAWDGRPDKPDYGAATLRDWMSKELRQSVPWLKQMNRIACLDLTRWLAGFQCL